MESQDLATLRELLEKALSECQDFDPLDLVYKILICDRIQ